MPVQTLAELIDHAVTVHDRRDMFLVKSRGQWVEISARAFDASVRRTMAVLHDLGVRHGDRMLLLSENRLEWAIVDAAAMRLGVVTVPIYPTLLAEAVAAIADRSEAVAAVGSTSAQLEKLATASRSCPSLRHLIGMDEPVPEGCLSLKSMQEGANPAAAPDASVTPGDLASLIFTSGTTGDPKGVMLTHDNIVQNVLACLSVFELGPTDLCLSFLPLSHIFERMAGYYTMVYAGTCVAYAESIDAVGANMAELQPTVMNAVPRVYEKIYNRVQQTALEGGPLKRLVFHWARRVGVRWSGFTAVGRAQPQRAVPWMLRVQHALADRLLFARLRKRTGDRLRFFISGSAPLALDLARFFWAARLPVLEGYGLTESSPVISLNTLDHLRLGSVGRPAPGVEVHIAEDGEILTRSRCVMAGYWKDREATAQAIDADGWFHTGDVGHLDEDGYLFITDRKKDLIKTSGGKWVAPQPIENELRGTRYIAEAVLIGDRRNYVVALIVPNFESLKDYARRHHLPTEDVSMLVREPMVHGLYAHLVDKVNARHSSFEQVKRFALLDHEFSLALDELTPSLKVKRRVVAQRYAEVIEALYAAAAPIRA